MSASRALRRHRAKALRRAVRLDTRRVARLLVAADGTDPREARKKAFVMLCHAQAVAFCVFQMGKLPCS